MNSYLVLEIRVWLLLVLIFVVAAALAVGVWFLLRWLRASRRAAVAQTQAAAEADAMQRRNRMLIRLDHELKNPLTALRTSVATVRSAAEDDSPDGAVIAQSARQIDTSDRKSTRLNSSHVAISYAVFCLKKKTNDDRHANHAILDEFARR